MHNVKFQLPTLSDNCVQFCMASRQLTQIYLVQDRPLQTAMTKTRLHAWAQTESDSYRNYTLKCQTTGLVPWHDQLNY